jgi:cytochrome c oxidase assembly protein subunit 15
MMLLAALGLTAWWVSRFNGERNPSRLQSAKVLHVAAWFSIIATVVAGATGAVAALADTLFPSTSLSEALTADFAQGSPLLIRMRWIHPAATLVALCCVGWLVLRVRTPLSRLVTLLLSFQFFLGVVDVLLLAPTWMQVLHLLGADIYWVALVALAADILWPSSSPATMKAVS